MKTFVKAVLPIIGAVAMVVAITPARVFTQQAGRIGSPVTVPGIDKPVRVVTGRFTSDVTFTSDTYWVLRGAVFIGEPARLTIQAGTRVIGETATRGTLIIDVGAQIMANGTASAPIVMTSDQKPGTRFRGDWGGLIINGRAPINLPGGVGIGEGSTGTYGGTNPNDNSGVIRYVRVEFAGIEFSPDNELNGIAFQGVGRGTTVDYVQIHFNKDDGIEMFGGTTEIKHVVLTNNGDDNIDWTWGWTGKLQFGVVQQRGDDTDQGIEADNHSSQQNLLPRSAPTIYNITMVGDPSTTAFGPESTDGMRLRVGTAGIIRNWILQGFKQAGIDVRDASTGQQIASGALSVTNGIMFQVGPGGTGYFGSRAESAALKAAYGSTMLLGVDPLLTDPYNHDAPNWQPKAGSPAFTMTPAVPPNDGFFQVANFIGAIGPLPTDDWTKGWTFYGR